MAQQPATVYSDRYAILRSVARGGMADVYLAHDQLLDRPVALKVLFPELSVDPSFVERFRREAQNAARLSHANIVPIYDWGESETDKTYFIVMEYVEGKPLSALIRSEGALLPDRAAGIGADVAHALAFAHRNGVIHRDVKPGNVLIDSHDNVKVTDFGIARAANATESLTQTGAVMGTATYFSPEQAQGQRVDARTDVYSLGVVLYEMVTGKTPFTGDSPVAIAYKHVREDPVRPRDVNSAIPAPFEAIVMKAMAKEPSDRYASADELRADLLRYRRGRTVMAAVAAGGAAGAAGLAAGAATQGAATQEVASTPATEAAGSAPATRAVTTTGDGTTVAPATVVEEPPAGPAPPPPERNRTGMYVGLLVAMLAALLLLLFLLGRTLGLFGDGSAQVTVPSVIGQPAAAAERTLTGLGLEVERRLEPSDATPDTVLGQEPPGNTKVDRGSTVTLRISQGQETVRVPSVVGQDENRARSTLEDLGFEVRTTQQASDSQPEGRVIEQSPRANAEAPKGSTVTLTVASGRSKVQVPSVVGQDSASAAAELGRAGFRVRTVREPSATVARDQVIRTDPGAGAQLDRGSTVTMVVSSGPETTTTQTPATTTTTATRPLTPR